MVCAPEHLDVYAIAFMRNVLVEEGVLQGAQGRLIIREGRGKVRIDESIPEAGRKRFVAAHELGHFELHYSKTALLFSCTAEYFDLWRHTNPAAEREANVFAAEFLMPKPMFMPLCAGCKPKFDVITKLAATFKTSLTATSIRFIDLTTEACILVSSSRGRVQWSVSSKGTDQRIRAGQRLSQNSYAHDFFQGQPLPKAPQEVLADAWLPDVRLKSGATLMEESFGMSAYGSVLTILHIENLIEAEDDPEDTQFTPDGRRYRW
jgi:Zn-dependent peptidase ImmA (M78 family)